MTASRRRPLPVNPYTDRPIEQWLGTLQSAGPIEDRYRALTAVTTLLPPEQAGRHVLTLLNDREPELRAASAHWFAVSRERKQLHDVNELGVNELGVELRNRLPTLLADADPDVRLAAAEMAVAWDHLTPQVREAVVELLFSSATEPTSLVTLARLLRRLPEQASQTLPRLSELLSAEQADVREAVVQTLSEWGPRSAPAKAELVTALDDEEPLVREHAARALGQIGDADACMRAALQTATQDEDSCVAAAAQESLMRLGETDVVQNDN